MRFLGQPERTKAQVLWVLLSQVGFSATCHGPRRYEKDRIGREKCTEGLGLGADVSTHALCELKKEFLVRVDGEDFKL